jgi:hypothetical protein
VAAPIPDAAPVMSTTSPASDMGCRSGGRNAHAQLTLVTIR